MLSIKDRSIQVEDPASHVDLGKQKPQICARSQDGESGTYSPELHNNQSLISVEYADLVAGLNSTVSMGLFKIELLPDSHPLEAGLNILTDDTTIVIPKKTLKNAFLSARQVFFDNLAKVQYFGQSQEAVLDASSIILLMMPEHLTAANARKRIIMNWENQSEEMGRKRIIMDLWMLDSMFLSLGNKHAKSPTLWSHRKWLMQRVQPSERVLTERTCSSSNPSMEREISLIVLSAAEVHPRNYYAWGYLRWWIAANGDALKDFGNFRITQSITDSITCDLPRLINTIMEWCLKHPSDTSGWSFLVWFISRADTAAVGSLRFHGPFVAISKNVLDSAISLRLRNEAVFVFLRTVFSSPDMPLDIRQTFIEFVEGITKSNIERSKSKSIAQSALQWLEKQ